MKFERILNRIGYIIGVGLLTSIVFALTSCSLTNEQMQMEYEINKLYSEYSLQRDSIIIKYNRNEK